VLGHLQASGHWLELLSGRLADGGETEAAELVNAARQDIDAVCARFQRTPLPCAGALVSPVGPRRRRTPDPLRAIGPQRRWLVPPNLRADAVGIPVLQSRFVINKAFPLVRGAHIS
jgi:hypothetical protein